MTDPELFSFAKQLQVPIDLLRETAKLGRLPVVNFAAGGLGNDAIISIDHSYEPVSHGVMDRAVACEAGGPGFDPSFIQMVFSSLGSKVYNG